MKQRGIDGRIERKDLAIAIRPLALSVQDRVVKLEAFALIVIEREPKQAGGVMAVDDELAEQRQRGEGE